MGDDRLEPLTDASQIRLEQRSYKDDTPQGQYQYAVERGSDPRSIRAQKGVRVPSLHSGFLEPDPGDFHHQGTGP